MLSPDKGSGMATSHHSGFFSPSQLNVMNAALRQASTILGIQPGSDDYETLAARVVETFTPGSTEASLTDALVGGPATRNRRLVVEYQASYLIDTFGKTRDDAESLIGKYGVNRSSLVSAIQSERPCEAPRTPRRGRKVGRSK
jgi:hypothetical protein